MLKVWTVVWNFIFSTGFLYYCLSVACFIQQFLTEAPSNNIITSSNMVTLSIWPYPWHVRNHRASCILRGFYSCKSLMWEVINVGWNCSCSYCICCFCNSQMWQVIIVDLNCRIPSCTCYSVRTKYLPPCHAFRQESEI